MALEAKVVEVTVTFVGDVLERAFSEHLAEKLGFWEKMILGSDFDAPLVYLLYEHKYTSSIRPNRLGCRRELSDRVGGCAPSTMSRSA